MQDKLKIISLSVLFSLIFLVVFGTLTVLIPNTFFARMTSIHYYDYIFLVLTSLLAGVSVALWQYSKSVGVKSASCTLGGTIGGVFSFGCAICNKLLILLLGLSGVMTYFMPLQPILGVVSIGLLGWGVHRQYKNIQLGKIMETNKNILPEDFHHA